MKKIIKINNCINIIKFNQIMVKNIQQWRETSSWFSFILCCWIIVVVVIQEQEGCKCIQKRKNKRSLLAFNTIPFRSLCIRFSNISVSYCIVFKIFTYVPWFMVLWFHGFVLFPNLLDPFLCAKNLLL